MKTRYHLVIIIASVIIAVGLGLFMIRDPKPVGKDSKSFSAENAYTYLEQLAKEPHSVFDRAALEKVRQNLQDIIQSLGLTPELIRHKDTLQQNLKTNQVETVEIHNIYAEIPGSSGQSILLMAHFDSSPYKLKYGKVTSGSHGAADDGYGVVTLLEIMRQLQNSDRPLVNGVKFLFTDSEETGLNGAEAFLNERPEELSDVNLVVNVEARGNRGPLYMFQTSSENTKIINLYSKVDRPFSYSVAAEVYKYLPSDTDLTPFLNEGYPCINFSTLNDLRSYHTYRDTLNNTSKATIQAYGTQVYSLMEHYVYEEAYSGNDSFISSSDSVFFTLLPGVLVHYPVGISWGIIAFTIIVTAIVLGLALKRKLVKPMRVLKSIFIWVLFTAAAAIVGYLAVWLPCRISGTGFYLTFMPYVPFDRFFLGLSAVLITAAAFGIMLLQKKLKCNPAEILSGGVLTNIVLLLTFGKLLHGGTYLYVWPVLLASLLLAGYGFLSGSKKWHTVTFSIVRAFLILFIVLMYFLLAYSLFLALTIGALAVILLLLSIPLGILVPAICIRQEAKE